jgi:prepilin-type N-terminal cleavage/methylation domain-containing protein/prepilin-type processing-associated H-X9-DG protein
MSLRTRARTRGFTLIELLVVIAIISILIGLLLPAVQRAREAANRAKCLSNLKNVALACYNYEVANGQFPPSRLPGESQTWAWLILPQLEQDNLYNYWPVGGFSIYNIPNASFMNTPVPVYFCPSRRAPGQNTAQGFTQGSTCALPTSVGGAVADYAASIGTTGNDGADKAGLEVNPADPANGTFTFKIGVRPADITDGLSNTLLLGEKHIPIGQFATYPYDCNTFDGHNVACSVRCAGPGYPIAQSPSDTRLIFGGPHPGLCQFAFADGHVVPVRNSISEYNLGLLAQRNDGLPPPTDY